MRYKAESLRDIWGALGSSRLLGVVLNMWFWKSYSRKNWVWDRALCCLLIHIKLYSHRVSMTFTCSSRCYCSELPGLGRLCSGNATELYRFWLRMCFSLIPTAISFLSINKQWDQVCWNQQQALATKAWTQSFPTCLWTEYCKSNWSKLLTTGTSLELVLVVTACTGESHPSSHTPSQWLLFCLAAWTL